jgi:peptidoglycan hydrolase-like protein with peptidoglycan-binding domain
VSTSNNRRLVLSGTGLVLVAVVVVVLVVSDPFAGSSKRNDAADNATPTSLATVSRRALSSQTQVSATLGYAGGSSVLVPAGTAPAAVAQAEQALSGAEGTLQAARASLSADTQTLAGQQASATAAREKESVDCAGEHAAETASDDGSPASESTPSGSDSGGGSLCASDVQSVADDAQGSSTDVVKVDGDGAAVASAERALASAAAAATAARFSAAAYDQGSTFTMLPSIGQVISRGHSLYQLAGQPVLLLYGPLIASRAFVRGMSPGGDVAELNANLRALGYGDALGGDTFSASTEAAIRAFQSAHGLAATGELALGSVAFEPGPVRVTSVTPTLGASMTPGPVLSVTSTTPQVTIALSAAEQSSVKVGDPVTITLPSEQTTPGVVTSVGSVAKAPSSKGGEGSGGPEGGEEGAPTIEVDVAPSDPSATGHLDEAPVTVSITTASVASALVVPVDSLLALAGGGYAIEVVQDGAHHLEAIALGMFDDAEGLVQVSGRDVKAGQRVVVPAT